MKRKILASILALSMIFSMVPTAAFADGETGSDSQTQIVETKKDETVDEQKSDEQKTDEQKSDEQKTDEQKSDEQKTDEQKSDEQKSDEQKTDEQKTDEQKSDEQKTNEPRSQGDENSEGRMMRQARLPDPTDGSMPTSEPNVAMIDSIAYSSLQKAIDAATAGQIVNLREDTTEDITIDKNITLDLGGKTLTNTGVGKATITVANSATVTIKNGSVMGGASYYNIEIKGTATLENVTATAGNNDSSMIDVWGNLTIKSGTYTGGLNVVKSEENSILEINGGQFELTHLPDEGDYPAVILVYGKATINNGMFIQSATKPNWKSPYVLVVGEFNGNFGDLTVNDGTFINKYTLSGQRDGMVWRLGNATPENIHINGGKFNKQPKRPNVPYGYEWKKVNGYYTLNQIIAATIDGTIYPSLEDAYAAAQPGQTIKLEKTATLNKLFNITKPVTIDGQGKSISAGKNFNGDGNNASLVQVNCPDGTVKFNNVKITTNSKNKHALNVYISSLVELTDVTLNHGSSGSGAPLIIAGSSVKVSGKFDVTVGKNSWYGINLDIRENKIPNLEIDENSTITFKDNSKKSLNFIDTECVNDDVVSAPQIKCIFEYKAENEAQTPHKVYNLTHGTMTHTEAVDATCTTDGNVAYWTCETCGKTYSDEQGTTEITKTVIEKLGHKMTKHEEVKATCTEKGMKAYYECSTCGKLYEDEAGTKEVTDKNTLVIDIDATNHKTKFVAEVAAGCEKEGVKAHYECERCGKLFTDAEGKNEVKATDLVIGATGHHWGEWKVVKAATTREAGIEQAICDYCGGPWQKEIPVRATASTGTATRPSNSGSTATKDNSSSSTSSTKENANPTKADTSVADVKRSEEVVSTVKENVKVADQKATVDKNLINKVKGEKGAAVVLPIASATGESVTSTEIAKDAVKAVMDNGSDLIVELTDATVKLDNETLKAVYAQAEGDSIEIRAVKTEVASLTEAQKKALDNYDTAVVVELQIYSNGKYIANFNGGVATIKIPFTPAEGVSADEYTVYYVGGDGKLTAVASEYVDGYMIISTGHFSSYAIVRTAEKVADSSSASSQPREQTGSSFPVVPVVIAVVALICLFVLLRKKNKED